MLVLACLLSPLPAAMAQVGYSDDLLPPEVVPMDPAVAQAMSQKQAMGRQTGMTESQLPPGMVGQPPANMPMQSAQDASRAMYNSLMGANGQLPPQFANYTPPGISPAGNGLGPAPGQQSGLMQPGQIAEANNIAPLQSQTLSAPAKHKPVRHDTRRGGFSNAFSAVAGFGSAVAMGGLVRRPSTGFGLGMFGMGLTGVGSRNGFRF